MQTRISVVLFALLLLLTSTVWAGERGYFGFAITVDGEGAFWNPTLRSVKIEKVSPKSPAALAGIVAGDEVLEVAGKAVAGAKGNDLKAQIEKDIGESVQVKLRHTNGDVAVVNMVAVAKTW
ncbi:MAG: PDZ domain-containing protein [Pseudomonadota bacterium]